MRTTILLADDSPTIRKLVTQTFADSNFDIVSVSNGEAAIKAFEETRPSVVLADIYMPGKNGYEVCTYVRSHPKLSATPVVLLVGAFDAFDDATARQSGATANITKPFEPGYLVELVMSILPPAENAEQGEKDNADLLGLEEIFKDPDPVQVSAQPGLSLSEEELDRIADRVLQRLSRQVIEDIAWEVVPEFIERAVRKELKKSG
jgi:DNA-binding response OmpR family regulator